MSNTKSKSSRRRSRKPKFASLKQHLSTPKPQPPSAAKPTTNHFVDTDSQVACLLEQDDASATITELFGPSSSSSAEPDEETTTTPSHDDWDEERLARRALRGRERRSTSSSSAVSCGGGGLSLKLDYEEIMKAWSDKGSLYIDGEGPQVVPQLQQISIDDCVAPSMLIEVGSSGASWRVPEMEVDREDEEMKRKVETSSSRKERVMRYREKRQSRLFSKRIRYEVRKLNAEKRPRIKGRFVKRDDDK